MSYKLYYITVIVTIQLTYGGVRSLIKFIKNHLFVDWQHFGGSAESLL